MVVPNGKQTATNFLNSAVSVVVFLRSYSIGVRAIEPENASSRAPKGDSDENENTVSLCSGKIKAEND